MINRETISDIGKFITNRSLVFNDPILFTCDDFEMLGRAIVNVILNNVPSAKLELIKEIAENFPLKIEEKFPDDKTFIYTSLQNA